MTSSIHITPERADSPAPIEPVNPNLPVMARMVLDEKGSGPRLAVVTSDGYYYFPKMTRDQEARFSQAVNRMPLGDRPYELDLEHLIFSSGGKEAFLNNEFSGIDELRQLHTEIAGRQTFSWPIFPKGARAMTSAPKGFVKKSPRTMNLAPTDEDAIQALSHDKMDAGATPLELKDKIARLKRRKAAELVLKKSDEILTRLETAVAKPTTREEASRLKAIQGTRKSLKTIDRFGIFFDAMHPFPDLMGSEERKAVLEKRAKLAKGAISQRAHVPKESVTDWISQAPYFKSHQAIDEAEEANLAKEYALIGISERGEYEMACLELNAEKKSETDELFYAKLANLIAEAKKDEALALVKSRGLLSLHPIDRAEMEKELEKGFDSILDTFQKVDAKPWDKDATNEALFKDFQAFVAK